MSTYKPIIIFNVQIRFARSNGDDVIFNASFVLFVGLSEYLCNIMEGLDTIGK